jgi:drug/metabolite transporter (DMT)-like permease
MSDDSPSAVLRGRLLLIVAASLWSLSGVIIKSPAIESIPLQERGLVLACYRSLFAACTLLPFVPWRKARWQVRLIPSAVSFAVMNFLYVAAFTRTTAGAASFLQYTSTLWVFLLGWLLFHERITRGNLFALTSALIGILIIVLSEPAGPRAVGNMIALASGVSYAAVLLSLRGLRDEHSTWVTVVNLTVSGVALLPLVLLRPVELTSWQWLLVAGLGFFQLGLPYVLATRGVALIGTQEAALLTLLEPTLIPLWAWFCWGESIGTPTLIGGACILGGLALRYVLWPTRCTSS